MDMYRIHDMLEDISETATTELAKGTENVNTKEFGEVVDMIKDLSEAEKNKMEACYYKTLIEAMEESDYGEDYDEYGPLERRGYRGGGRSGGGRGGNRGGGNRGGGRGGRRSYEEMWDDPRFMEERMGYSNGAYGGGSRGQSSGGQGGQSRGYQGGQQQSRYGYSHDDYMNERKMYSSTDPESMKKRAKIIDEHMDDMYEMFKEEVQDMTPEEKQMWKSKLNKIINL